MKSKYHLATFETPLWLSVNRGAKVTKNAGGIKTTVVADCMTRSILLQAPNATYANQVINDLKNKKPDLEKTVSQSSKFAKLENWHSRIVADLIYLRLSFDTNEAAGHNMATKAAQNVQNWIFATISKIKIYIGFWQLLC